MTSSPSCELPGGMQLLHRAAHALVLVKPPGASADGVLAALRDEWPDCAFVRDPEVPTAREQARAMLC